MAFTRKVFQKDKKEQVCEYYMTVGLNSNLTEKIFKRNSMNLVICIDKSGLMSFYGV